MDAKYILYLLKSCIFCRKAVDILELNNISYHAVYFDDNATLLDQIKHAYSWNTVPIVFENLDNYKYNLVGGYTELQLKLESEKADDKE
tara:strand:+ start:270 stop:536 length:267 start_codon:yes stop_codon:yes gene_type:complete